jgi:hypothetical protein
MKNIFVPPLYSCQNPDIADIITPLKPVKPVSSPYSEMICAAKNTYVYDAQIAILLTTIDMSTNESTLLTEVNKGVSALYPLA